MYFILTHVKKIYCHLINCIYQLIFVLYYEVVYIYLDHTQIFSHIPCVSCSNQTNQVISSQIWHQMLLKCIEYTKKKFTEKKKIVVTSFILSYFSRNHFNYNVLFLCAIAVFYAHTYVLKDRKQYVHNHPMERTISPLNWTKGHIYKTWFPSLFRSSLVKISTPFNKAENLYSPEWA